MVDMLMVLAEAPPTLATRSRRARPMVALARRPGPNTPAAQLMSRAMRAGPLTMKRGEWKLVVADTPWRSKASSHMASTPAISTGMYSGRQPAMTALMAIFSTEARPKLGGTNAISSPASRPDPATMVATRSRVGGTTGSPSVTPRSKSASKGSVGSEVTAASGLADAELAVVTLGHRVRVVGIGEHGDAGGLGRIRLLEELLVVLEDVDALFRPLPFPVHPAPDHQHPGQPPTRGEARAHGDHRAPDVLEGLHRPGIVGEDGVDGHRAVVGLRLPLVRALGKLHGTPRPREDRVRLRVPLVLLGGLDTETLGQGVEEPQAVHLLDGIHLAPGVLPRLPVRGKLADLALGEVVDGDAVLGARRGGKGEQSEEEKSRAHAPDPQRPRRHQEWTSWSTTWTSWPTVRHSLTMSQEGE